MHIRRILFMRGIDMAACTLPPLPLAEAAVRAGLGLDRTGP